MNSAWFVRWRERSHLRNIKVEGEATIPDGERLQQFPNDLAQILIAGGYNYTIDFQHRPNSILLEEDAI